MPETVQRRHMPIDQLDRLTPRWDEIVRRASLATRSATELHELESQAQQFADDLIAVFRGRNARRPSAAPLYISPDGQSAGW